MEYVLSFPIGRVINVKANNVNDIVQHSIDRYQVSPGHDVYLSVLDRIVHREDLGGEEDGHNYPVSVFVEISGVLPPISFAKNLTIVIEGRIVITE